MTLNEYSTSCLIKEIEKREGVEKIIVEPYKPFKIVVDEEIKSLPIVDGACVILVIWD